MVELTCVQCSQEFIVKNNRAKQGAKFCSLQCNGKSRKGKKGKSNVLNRTHGMYNTIFYKKWCGMKRRCTCKYTNGYINYGGRGIKFSKKWNNFENFRNDLYESFLSHVKIHGEKETQLDRIDSNKNYTKKNCKWSTQKEQQNNRRSNHFLTFQGETLTIQQWAEKLKMKPITLSCRISKYHWPIAKALTEPINQRFWRRSKK